MRPIQNGQSDFRTIILNMQAVSLLMMIVTKNQWFERFRGAGRQSKSGRDQFVLKGISCCGQGLVITSNISPPSDLFGFCPHEKCFTVTSIAPIFFENRRF